jgi:hypothetical protein
MALFNPPLIKPGNKKCPNCGQSQWEHLWWTGWLLSKWHCSKCQSVLETDGWRWFLSSMARVVAYLAILLPIISLRPVPSWTILPAVATLAAVTVLAVWWFDSVRLKSTAK